jgi:hypothetical protein
LVSSPFIFDPVRALVALADAGVDFVVIGGVAGGAHGSAYPTYDVDVAVEDDADNLGRLRDALEALGADAPHVEAGGLFDTTAGLVDVAVHPPNSAAYAALRDDSLVIDVSGRSVRLASLDHLIAMREARDWPYDMLWSLELRALSDEQRAQS